MATVENAARHSKVVAEPTAVQSQPRATIPRGSARSVIGGIPNRRGLVVPGISVSLWCHGGARFESIRFRHATA